MKVAPLGGVTTRCTPVAVPGPALATVTVKVRSLPAATGFGVADWETDSLAVAGAAPTWTPSENSEVAPGTSVPSDALSSTLALDRTY